jgi:hypothetical protein
MPLASPNGMSATSSSRGFSGDRRQSHAEPTDPLIHRRRRTALALTVFTVALGVLLTAAIGRDAFIIYFFALPVALTLLWASTSDKRFDERPEGSEGEGER